MDLDVEMEAGRASPLVSAAIHVTRGYQQEMLEESVRRNIIIALDTGSGKTHIAVLRLKHEMEVNSTKVLFLVRSENGV